MHKRLLIFFAVLLAGSGLAWLINWNNERQARLPAITDKDRIRAAARLNPKLPMRPELVALVPIAPSHPIRLAIGWLGLRDETQTLQVADLLTAELGSTKGLELVERQSLDRVLHELGLSFSGLVRAQQAVRVGKLLRADWFLLGTPTVLNGTNSMVARLVDARTGIMRDGAVFPYHPIESRIAAELASFVRRCRQDAAQPRPRVYLAVGAFEDLSVNSRQARFPTQLRGRLTSAYQRSGVTLLEREYVNTLLREVHLDLAGLTEEGANHAPMPMQAAFWLVEGSYQSFETSERQVELNLTIRRMFGRNKEVSLRGNPDEALLDKVKEAIDSAMNDAKLIAVPTRSSEIRAQLAAGKALGQIGAEGLIWGVSFNRVRPVEPAIAQRNTEEAIRAFETVLLLDPGEREAKLYLAACLRNRTIGRVEEARSYYRQVIESPTQDAWTGTAQAALLNSFHYEGPAALARWLESVAPLATSLPARAFYQQAAQTARADDIIAQGDSPKAQELAEPRLFEDMKSWNKDLSHGIQIVDFYNTGLGKFTKSFGTNNAAAAKRLVELLPRLQEQTPELAPHILAGVASAQVDTNALVISQFERSLDENTQHPEKVFKSDYYFSLVSGPVYYWCTDRKLYGLGAKVIEAQLKAPTSGSSPALEPEKMMSLAFARMGVGRWREALDVFLCYSNRPLAMGNSGLWGDAFSVVLTGKEAAYCQQKLGLTTVTDPREFTLGKPALCMHTPSAFCLDNNVLWIGLAGQLLQLDLALHTNRLDHLPLHPSVPINFLSVTPSNIWISTGGAGLITFDKASHECQRLTEADGLLMDYVNQARPAGDTLWIAYGSETAGGLGRLDLRTRKVTSFTPSLFPAGTGNDSAENAMRGTGDGPPRRPIRKFIPGADGDIWFAQSSRLRRFRSSQNLWETFPDAGSCSTLTLAPDRLLVGRHASPRGLEENQTGLLGLSILDLAKGAWQHLPAQEGLPHESVTAITLDGRDVWLGGMGFVACVDPDSNQVRRYAYVRARSVDQIQVAGGYLWAQFDGHLYRAPLL